MDRRNSEQNKEVLMTFIRGIITKLYENILERIAFFCMFYG